MSIICHADISKSTDFNLQHNITVFKDEKLVFMSVSGKGDARYEVPMARSSHTGDYRCVVEANGKKRYSDSLHVWVTGMTKPILIAEKKEVFEGEVVKLRCELPEEVPPLHFIFRKMKMNSKPKEKLTYELQRNFSVIEFPIEEGDNILQFDCLGKRNVKFEFETSEPSNRTLITVKEPFIKPTLRIKPSSNITEGKEIQFECSTVVAKMRDIEIMLLRNKTILSSVRDQTTLKYSAVATLEDSGEYLCKVEEGKASKIATRNVVVTELFPKPVLTASMNKLDENKELTLSCSIKDFQNASFSILRRNSNGGILLRNSRNFTTRAKVNDTGLYICKAEVNRIVKESKPVMIQVYAPVSMPNISVFSGLPEVVLGKPLKLTCCLKMGTPPITFTFYKGNKAKKEIVTNNTCAVFLDEDIKQNDKGQYKCGARNHHSSGMKTSKILNITVIVPIRNISLGSVPYGEVEDGGETAFLCSVKEGSWPILFRIFRKTDRDVLLFERSEHADRVMWQKKEMSRQDTGTYYCIASNRANVSAKSHPITINVILASWQKGVITAFVLIPIAGVVILAVWWFWCKKKNAKGPSMEMSRSALATNSTSEKLSRQHDGDYYSGSGYIEDGENHMKSTDENKGPDLESAEVEYTEVEVSTLDPHRAPVQKGTETVYSEIRKANNDSVENRHSRIQGHPDAT